MDPRLLHAYNDELVYLREAAREFGEEHQGVAGRLGLNAAAEVDPHVERLLEGVAFLGARVQLKLRDQFPEFTQHLLHALQPHYVAPTPSMCVVGFQPREDDTTLAEGVDVPRGTQVNALADDREQSLVTFSTGHDVSLWPLRVAEAEYLPSRAAVAPFLPSDLAEPVEAGLRIRIAATGGVSLGGIAPGSLPVYLDGAQSVPGELYRQLIGDAVAAVIRPAGSAAKGSARRLPLPEQYGFDESCALLPADRRSHRGYRLLTEYFACPERFLFVRFGGLDAAFADLGEARACDIIILFRRRVSALDGAVGARNIRLFATPAINLFEKQTDRIPLSGYDHELQVLADRTRPLGFEIFRLLDVKAHHHLDGEISPVVPLYDYAGLLYDWNDALFYVTRLRPRRLSTREQRLNNRTGYVGTETVLSLTAPGRADRVSEVRELSIRALVTNRDLPERVRTSGPSPLTVEGVPVRGVALLRPPTPPRPPLGLHDGAWRVIGHLTPNFTSFADDPDGDASVLRSHLALYARVDEPALRRQVDGVRRVRGEPVSRRAPGEGPSAFIRGRRLSVALDEGSFENGRMFLFGAVLERFLSEFASINSFVECTLETTQRETVMRWPARLGRRPTI